MDEHEQDAEILRQRERVHDLSNIMQSYVARLTVVERDLINFRELPQRLGSVERHADAMENDVENLKTMAETWITRAEFTPVARVVYGLVAFILGGAVMAMLGVIFKVVR